MAALLAPFESSTQSDQTETLRARTSVQENLVTRNGEVERELEKMRLLLARVTGRVAQLPDEKAAAARGNEDAAAASSMDIDSMERDKVERLLDRL
jgi:hypothetical protein